MSSCGRTAGISRAARRDGKRGHGARGCRHTLQPLGWMALLAFASGCGPSVAPNTDVLRIGAYSVVREVLHGGLLPAFASEWKSRSGRNIEFQESYNASGAQARAFVQRVLYRIYAILPRGVPE